VLLLLRSDRPLRKEKIKGNRGAVELLAEGQHFIIDGWHPLSHIKGHPVRWTWRDGRAPWNTRKGELPIIPADEVSRALEHIEGSGVLGEAVPTLVPQKSEGTGKSRSVFPATERLHQLFEQYDGLVKPAIQQLIEETGAERSGRHDCLVAICGRLVLQRWDDQRSLAFLTPIINAAFGEGDWSREIQTALDHARRRDNARLQAMRGVTWKR
jgi:hypothetical protein